MRETMASFIRRRNAQGHTFLVVSHDMPIVRNTNVNPANAKPSTYQSALVN